MRNRTIKGLRADLYLSQKDIAEKINIPLSKYTNAESALDDEELLSKLAEALQVKKIEVHITL